MAGETNHSPYAPNFEGVVGALLDFKDTSPSDSAFKLFGVELTCFENVTQGNALYIRASDGKVGKAIANGTLDQATVFGIAETTKTTATAETTETTEEPTLPLFDLNFEI